jgi:Flp pilus assembly protein TadD
LGSILIAQRNYPLAVDVLDLARQQAPNDPQVLALLSNAFMGRGRSQIATRYLEQALELTRGAPDMQTTLGLNLIQTGQQEAGLRQLEAAFTKRPRDSGVGAALALLYLQRSENRSAVEVAQKISADPNALNLLGVTLGALGIGRAHVLPTSEQ